MAQSQVVPGARVRASRLPRQGLHDAVVVRLRPHNGARRDRVRDVVIRFEDDGAEVVTCAATLVPQPSIDGPSVIPAWLASPEDELTSDELRQIRGAPSMAPRRDD